MSQLRRKLQQKCTNAVDLYITSESVEGCLNVRDKFHLLNYGDRACICSRECTTCNGSCAVGVLAQCEACRLDDLTKDWDDALTFDFFSTCHTRSEKLETLSKNLDEKVPTSNQDLVVQIEVEGLLNGYITLLRSDSDPNTVIFSIDAYLAECVTCTLQQSTEFLSLFPNFVRTMMSSGGKIHPIPTKIIFVLQQPRQYRVDFKWCNIVEKILTKKSLLDDTMAWLSTLGGGYSALGDYFEHHAEHAQQITIKQMRVAMVMGDPIMQCRCRIYFAQSLVQKGRLSEALTIIRTQKRLIRSQKLKDHRLPLMCKAIVNRIRYVNQIIKETSNNSLSLAR